MANDVVELVGGGAWAALVVALNVAGVVATRPDQPPLPLLISVIAPPILFAIAYSVSAKVRSLSLGLDLILLTAIQGWRIIGAMFLVLMSFRLLPGVFAWPAGIGDMIVGAYAPFVVLAISRRTPGWQKQVVLLNILGLLDFVGAIGGGVLGGIPIGLLLVMFNGHHGRTAAHLIRTFFVPFWIVLHTISPSKSGNQSR
jgi:hypothetical protein